MDNFTLPLKSFYIIRHGESEANLKGLTAGISNVLLTENGRQQARLTSMLIKQLNLANPVIYSSPLKRVQQTAEIISRNKVPRVTIVHLQERNFGVSEGEKWSITLEKHMKGEHIEGSERMDEFIERCHLAFDFILRDSLTNSTTPLVIGHAGNFDAFGRFYNSANMHPISNCAVYYFIPNTRSSAIPWEIYKVDFDASEFQIKYLKSEIYF